MNRHDAMRKIYDADPEAHEWRWKPPSGGWSPWLVWGVGDPECGGGVGWSPWSDWRDSLDYEIRRRDGKPLVIPDESRHAEMRARYEANPEGDWWRFRINGVGWSPWSDCGGGEGIPLWNEDADYEIEPIDPPSHRDGMPNALHPVPTRPEDVFDPVNSPSHYTQGDIECIDAMVAARGMDAVRIYCELAAFKYLWRKGSKGDPAEDLGKAIWYLRFAAGDDPRKDGDGR